jgi:sarcosine oxidase
MADFDVTVVGAGVFGAWTAWHLGRAGKSVLLVDAWGPGHSRASSGGESRIIRMGYGADEIYTRMAMRSLEQWKAFCRQTGHDLFVRTGVLWMARPDDPYSTATLRTIQRAGVPAELLSADELARGYPQLRLPHGDVFGIFEPESGVLMARRAVSAVVADGAHRGVTFRREAAAPPVRSTRQTMVFACGPWLPKLFPALLSNRIFPTRQEVFFFAPPAGDTRFGTSHLPVWIDFTHPLAPYGFPDLEARGCKLAFDRHGPPFDPDTGDRQVSAESVDDARAFLAERFPALRHAPLAESRVCQYENTSNGDFLIDRHPQWENIWLVGGGSGHGFKHGPAVGEYVAQRILHGGAVDPRFSLTTKDERQERTVH